MCIAVDSLLPVDGLDQPHVQGAQALQRRIGPSRAWITSNVPATSDGPSLFGKPPTQCLWRLPEIKAGSLTSLSGWPITISLCLQLSVNYFPGVTEHEHHR